MVSEKISYSKHCEIFGLRIFAFVELKVLIMQSKGQYTYAEIMQQPRVWKQQYDRIAARRQEIETFVRSHIERGYLIFFREQNPDRKARIETWLPENSKVRLTPVLGSGKAAVQKTGRRGTLEVELPAPNDYAMYRYELIR